MGVMQFAVHAAELLAHWPEANSGYITASDGRVFPTRIELAGNILRCHRQTGESGKLHIAWPVPGFGRIVLSTTSLSERAEPYHLALELARGKLVQVRNQLSSWELGGMRIPVETPALIRQAYGLFTKGALAQQTPEVAFGFASDSIRAACEAAQGLVRAYAEQSLAGRMLRYPNMPMVMGADLGHAAPHRKWDEAFPMVLNMATLNASWKSVEIDEGEYFWETTDAQLEWCEAKRIVPKAGPLVDFSEFGFPGWLNRYQKDLFALQGLICRYVEAAVKRYQGRVRIWEIATRANTGGGLGLTEEQRLTFLARLLETARRADEDCQMFVRVDEPWGEYLSRGQHRLAPLQMVDALARSGVGLAGVNLEIATGYRPDGTPLRDLLDCSRLIDQWSVLGLPLYVTLVAPSADASDEETISQLEVTPGIWNSPLDAEVQASWASAYMTLFSAKPAVAGVQWGQLTDAAPHHYPHGGLYDAEYQPKPVLAKLRSQRTGAS